MHTGDMRQILGTFEPESFDACVTDPPYHLTSVSRRGSARQNDPETPFGRTRLGSRGFMGKTWDGGDVAFRPKTWRRVYRVLKPGGHLIAFGGTRTWHRLWCAVEDAGFEIRDTLLWIYGSGFPKSLNVAKAIEDGCDIKGDLISERWDGWGTSLKPAWEPILLARKPLIGTVVENVLQHGTGALNIDGCRIALNGDYKCKANGRPSQTGLGDNYDPEEANQPDSIGRWPANVVHDGSDEVVGLFPEQSGGGFPTRRFADKTRNTYGVFEGHECGPGIGATGGNASRFFYSAKASREDREWGCEGLPELPLEWSNGEQNPGSFQSEGTNRKVRNNHPSVKPTDLMRWLCRLVTRKGGRVIDPFAGSGSTGKACAIEGFEFDGIELDPHHVEIANCRIGAANKPMPDDRYAAPEPASGQKELF